MGYIFSKWKMKSVFLVFFVLATFLTKAQTWSEKDEIIPNPLPKNSQFGHEIQVDGDVMVVADFLAHSTTTSLTEVGYVYVYQYDSVYEKWKFTQRLASPDSMTYRQFGVGISFHDSTLVIGGGYIYTLQTNGKFQLTQRFTSVQSYLRAKSNKKSFYSISFTDSFLAICAAEFSNFKPTPPLVSFGAVILYKKDRQKQEWVAHDTITALDTLNGVNFGSEALFFKDLLLVSCIEDPKDLKGNLTNKTDAGSVYVFKQNSNGKWTQTQKLKAQNFDKDFFFGFSLCQADDYALVSAPLHAQEVNGKTLEGVGAIYSYKKAPSGDTLVLDTVLFAVNSYWDWFGNDLAYENGYLAVGMPFRYVRNWTQGRAYEDAGSVRIFKLDSGKWSYVTEVANPEPLQKYWELMGRTVAWHGTELITYRWRTFPSNGSTSSYVTHAVNIFDICPPTALPVYDTICEGDTTLYRFTSYADSGKYQDTLTFKNGCNSIHEINVFAHPSYDVITDTSLCSTSSLSFQGNVYSSPGAYLVKYNTVKGCDSSFTLNLTYYPTYIDTAKTSICEGDSVSFKGSTFWPLNDTVLTDTFPSQFGCDSIANLNVSLIQSGNGQIGYPTGHDESDSVLQFTGVYDSLHWVRCGTNEILHKNSSSFTTTYRNSFFANYYLNGCSNTTNCLSLNKWKVSIGEIHQLPLSCQDCEVWIYDILGRPLAETIGSEHQTVMQSLRGNLVVMVFDVRKSERRVFRVYR